MGAHYEVREFTGSDPVSFVISLNLHRRHLSEGQRATVAAKLANLSLGANRHSGASANLQTHPMSQTDAAEMLNVSTRTAFARMRRLKAN